MTETEQMKQEILNRLQDIDIKHIFLFGSYSHGRAERDSDIDLYVVTKDQFTPRNYRERRELVRKVSRPLTDLRQKVSIDLLVHTLPMNARFFALNSSFARDIREQGIRLL